MSHGGPGFALPRRSLWFLGWKGPVQTANLGLSVAQRGGKKGSEACCARRARPGQKGKFTAKLTTNLRFPSRTELLRSSFTVRTANRLHLILNSGQTIRVEKLRGKTF